MVKMHHKATTMNKILTELPKGKNNKINWSATVGMQVVCLYNDNEYTVTIINYDIKERKLTIKYGEKECKIHSCQFSKGGIGNVLNKYVMDYRYNIGDIVEVNGRKLKILDRYRAKHKLYMYECLYCGNKDTISESRLMNNHGCNVCCSSPLKVLRGYNDLATTNPDIVKFLSNKNDAYIYSSGSNKKVSCICPICGTKKDMTVHHLCKKGVTCNNCSDKISYPNKFIFNFLSQLNLNFVAEKTFKWSEGKRYDFYIPSIHAIIEAHGLQHYQESGYLGRNFQEEQCNDLIKKTLAESNGITNYIVLDCRESSSKFIINSILKSKIASLFDISNVDWTQCNKYATSNLANIAIDMWNEGTGIALIAKHLGLTKVTISKYLKNANDNGKCIYNGHEEMIKSNTRNSIKVISLTDGKEFNSIKACATFYGISRDSIKKNTKGLFKLIYNKPNS